MIIHSHADIHGGEHRKYIRLNGGHQNLNEGDHNHDDGGTDPHQIRVEDECETHQAQEDNVPRCNRHKESNHQRDWLGEHANDFDGNNDRLQRKRNAWSVEDVSPVVLVATQVGQ